jgi:3-deoxy-manno-octulosonate cytidylyltransferase (CMP-KDO synthetase)
MSENTCAIVIPARMASTRLPEKPLQEILGMSLIMRVYQRAQQVDGVRQVIVATDHPDIYHHVIMHGGNAVMTSEAHLSGTDRVAEAAQHLDADIIINIQGDEPLIHPAQIEQLVMLMQRNDVWIGTQCQRLQHEDELFDYNVVKVARDMHDKALYFSRQAIPAFRDKPFKAWMPHAAYFRHVGMYGFKKSILETITALPPSSLEITESLEQLRWLENGFSIHCIETEYTSVGVDTVEDLEKVKQILLRDMFG